MAVLIDDVKVWITYAGISHAVASRSGHVCITACSSMIWGDPQPTRAKRVCRKCRERLKKALQVVAKYAEVANQ